MIFILVAILFVVFCLSLFFCRHDFFRPSVLFSFILLASSISAFFLTFSWDFQLTAFSVFGFSISSVIVLLMDVLIFLPSLGKTYQSGLEISEIKTAKSIDFFVIIFIGITIIFHILYLFNTFGVGSLLFLANQYRLNVVWSTLSTPMSNALNRLENISMIFAYIYTYIFVNNVVVLRIRKNLLFKLIPIIMYCADSLLMGARGYTIYLIVSAVTYAYVLMQRKNGWNYKTASKSIKKIAYIVAIVAILFSISSFFFTRSESQGLLYHIFVYLGGGIPLFNEFAENSIMQSSHFGENTFYSFYVFLRSKGVVDFSNTYQYEFRHNWGNVYTAIRRYYSDFGVIGIICCMIIFSCFFSILYKKIKLDTKKHYIDIKLLIYGMLIRSIIFFFIDDQLFSVYCTPLFIKTVFEICISCYIICGLRINKSKIYLKKIT